ncbi:MAG: hypothetical protein E6I81_02050 [Chloroflexi bacterium]|nr:MAG: hypothetical protein AUI15_39035 [Actinobacteria bacterium 13_2_20CM_2_66_6]TMD37219.1 MAG: hypothetical protein E6I89_09345 [Chloroflexota bacterium]TMD73994.1 MAG: hypothetical protein E6I81_02050 [Chloroflexota bacterium]
MANRSRAKAAAGSGKGKSGRRPPVRAKSGSDLPLLAVVVAVILGLLVIVMIGAIIYFNRPQPGPQTVAGIPCDHLEHSQVHYHAAVQIVYHGVLTNIRDNTGIQTDSAGNVTCYYWLHVHPANKNVIHIESPANDTFTLGQFFDVSNAWSQANGFGAQKLDATHVATFTLQPGDKIVAYVDLGDGKGPQPFTGDPRSIVLRSHEVITIEISPPDVNPPPAFDWKSAANSGL